MPQYDVTSPDGKKFRINAPEGATQEQVMAYAQEQFKNLPANDVKPDPAEQRRAIYEDTVKKRGWGTGLSKAIYELGGKVTDATGSPLLGAATTALGEAVPMALMSGRVVDPKAVPVMEKAARGLMHSALKPKAKDIVSGDAAQAIDTLLKEGVNVSSSGAVKLRTMIRQLEKEAQALIDDAAKTSTQAGLPPAAVDKAFVASEIAKELKKFSTQVNPGADVKAVLASWDEFKNLVGNKIPIQEAHALKKGTYKLLANKYAQQGTVENVPGTQAQMAMARGLRLGSEDVVPGLGKITAKESSLINALEMAEKRAGIGGNKDIGGIAWLANNPAAATAMMADRSSAFKSWLANKIYQARNAVPAATRSGAFAGASALDQQDK